MRLFLDQVNNLTAGSVPSSSARQLFQGAAFMGDEIYREMTRDYEPHFGRTMTSCMSDAPAT